MIVETRLGPRNCGGRPERSIESGERRVIARVGVVALVLQAPQHHLERLGSVVGHQAPARPPAAAATGATRPSTGLLADA